MPKPFIPAAHYHVLTPFYEALTRPFAAKIWERVAEEVAKQTPEQGRVVDVGCGPGTILRLVHERRPDLHLTGIDVDPAMTAIARRKAKGKNIVFLEASADALPLPDASADLVVSSLVFHHLNSETKQAAFSEVKRILKPGGYFLLCDFSLERGTDVPWWLITLARFEPGALPQLEGELIELGHNVGAQTYTLWTMYGCVSFHIFTFPSR